jgi:cytochrome P450
MKRAVTKPDRVSLDKVDLSDLDRFRDDRAWGQFDALRREDPLLWNPEPEPNSGFWAVTRDEGIWAVDRGTESFATEPFVNMEELPHDVMDIRRSLLRTGCQCHQAARALIAREFSPHSLVKNYENFLHEL